MRPITIISVCIIIIGSLVTSTSWARKPAPKEARAYIVQPRNGEIVHNPVKVIFGLSGMGIAPAGFDKNDTGHHHLLIDMKNPPAPNLPIPSSNQSIHFGGGQTETEITLTPGTHTLQLILGDHTHIPHDPPVISEQITITVK